MDKSNEILKTEKYNELKNGHNSTITKILDNIYELVNTSNKLIDRLKDKNLLDEEDHENLENNYKEFKKIGFVEDLEHSINYFKIEYK
jgi:spermidine/putrescine-binding protein